MKNSRAILIISIVCLCFFIGGLSLMLVSSFQIKEYYNKYKVYESIDAVVEKYASKNEYYAIIVGYTVNGKDYSKVSEHYSKHPKEIGTKIEIKYNSFDPSEAIWMPLNNLKMFLLLGLSIFLVIVSVSFGYVDYQLIKTNRHVNYIVKDNGFYYDEVLDKEGDE